MKSILDHSFHYTSSVNTDLKKTFARLRREQREQDRSQNLAGNKVKVLPIRQGETPGSSSTRTYSKKS